MFDSLRCHWFQITITITIIHHHTTLKRKKHTQVLSSTGKRSKCRLKHKHVDESKIVTKKKRNGTTNRNRVKIDHCKTPSNKRLHRLRRTDERERWNYQIDILHLLKADRFTGAGHLLRWTSGEIQKPILMNRENPKTSSSYYGDKS